MLTTSSQKQNKTNKTPPFHSTAPDTLYDHTLHCRMQLCLHCSRSRSLFLYLLPSGKHDYCTATAPLSAFAASSDDLTHLLSTTPPLSLASLLNPLLPHLSLSHCDTASAAESLHCHKHTTESLHCDTHSPLIHPQIGIHPRISKRQVLVLVGPGSREPGLSSEEVCPSGR